MIKENARGEQQIWRTFAKFAGTYEESYSRDSNCRKMLQRVKVEHSDQRRSRGFAGFMERRRRLLVADRLGAVLVTSATSHHRKHKLVTVSLADSTDDCTGIQTGNDASSGSKKVPTTPTTPMAR